MRQPWPVVCLHRLAGAADMKLSVPKDHLSTMDGLTVEIVDEDDDDYPVGDVKFDKSVGRHVTLFDRYKGTFKTHDETVAFVKGVQAVIEYMIDQRT
jgi:hypothetical protein